MIHVNEITKTYGKKTSVNNLTFNVEKGHIVGFLGPNGAGKSTTMRMILGLDKPTQGEILIDNEKYEHLDNPIRKVGALLDASYIHPKRTAQQHLDIIGTTNNISKDRIQECLALVGLEKVANKNAGEFSLGMKQRLGIAAALLGDPDYLILDEPVNGLDPSGIHWVREFMNHLASEENKGILISSHQIGELSKMAHDLVVIQNGNLVFADTMKEFTDRARSKVDVSSPQLDILVDNLKNIQGVEIENTPHGVVVSGIPAQVIGEVAMKNSIILTQLASRDSLEEAFLMSTTPEFSQRKAEV